MKVVFKLSLEIDGRGISIIIESDLDCFQTLLSLFITRTGFYNKYILYRYVIIKILGGRAHKECWAVIMPSIFSLNAPDRHPLARPWARYGVSCYEFDLWHYCDVISIACQVTDASSVCSSVCSGADQRKHQSSTPLAFVSEIHR